VAAVVDDDLEIVGGLCTEHVERPSEVLLVDPIGKTTTDELGSESRVSNSTNRSISPE